jgi:hypothetical protein
MHYERRDRLRQALKVLNKIGQGVRSPIRRPSIVVEIDLEPDEYYPTVWGRAAWEGVERAFQAADSVRNALAAVGHRARFSWGLRLDPQVAIGEGRPDFVLSEFEDEIAAARRSGDSFGLHPHWFRLIDGDWVEDTIDAAWVQHCIGVSLDTFRAGFGRTPTWIHFGQSWMNQACFNRVTDEGIRLVLTPEPGMKIEPIHLPGPPFRGTYPEYPSHLRRPYWGSRRDFRCRGIQRRTIVVPRTAAPLPNARRGESTHTNCWVSDDKTKFQTWIEQARADGRGGYFVLAGRSHVFRDPAKIANLVANLTWLVVDADGPQGDLTTPEEAFLDA